MAVNVQEASSANSSYSNSTRNWKFDVFLSFRGEDTRKTFTDHLYTALCKKGFKVFRDDDELERGEVISEKLLQAIEDSLFAIVIVSKNYASSSWCLDELLHILASRDELGQQVLPIFYHVDPSDVRHQRKSFGEAFAMHEMIQKDHEKVQNWRDSLTKVANLAGWDSKEWHEAELIERVVEELWTKLRRRLSPHSDDLIGIDRRVYHLESLLEIGLNDVRFVGIWGLGGIGKTTIARAVFEKFHSQFDICCFLANVRTTSERDGEVHLQRKFLSHLKIRNMEIEDTYEGRKTIQNLYCNRKVLLILDDVSSIIHLQNLAGSPKWFGAGSRVIITTRDLHWLTSHGVHAVYEVETMNDHESLQLFCLNAFKRDKPQEGFFELSKSVCDYAGGLPLALCVLGCFFCGRSMLEWEDALDMLKKDPDKNIFTILRISYDALNYTEQTIFLDIACFFNGWNTNEITQILKSCGLNSTIGIRTLIEKSLLKDYGAFLIMHDLLEQMGRTIVFEESPDDVGKRSRLWSKEDIDEVLEKNMGTKLIQGMVSSTSCEAWWDPEAFSSLQNLKLLIVSNDFDLPHGLKCLSDALKVLRWTKYPLDTLPPHSRLDKLVDLKMRHSKLRQLWNKSQCSEKLKFLDLSHSKYLIKSPNFFELPNLEKLELEDCEELVELHPSLGQLKKLQLLNLKGCKNLKVLPKKLEMTSLKEFVLYGCIQVRNVPIFGENMKNLVTLDVGETNLVKLPESIGLLTGLETLKLRGCKNLVSLPQSIHNLKRLVLLDISGCSKFSRLPENMNEIEALEKLDASGTNITEVPSSIGDLKKLKTMSFHGCKRPMLNSWSLALAVSHMFPRHSFHKGLMLPASIFNLKSLKELDLSYCSIDDGSVLDDLSSLSSLETLDLSGNMFVSLPAGCISNLLNLKVLRLNSCSRLQSLPPFTPNLHTMDARECASLETSSDEQSLQFLASIDQAEQIGPVRRLGVTIPGCEIPSWFENQNDVCLNEKREASIIIDIPPCEEWLGMGLCTVIEGYSTGDNKKIYSSLMGRLVGDLCWWLDFVKASLGKSATLSERLFLLENETKSPHLWIVCWKFDETVSYNLSRKYSHIRLRFKTYLKKPLELDGVGSIKCGWRIICKGDFEKWGNSMSHSLLPISEQHKDEENTMCSEAEEQGQCDLPAHASSQAIINKCESPREPSSSCSEEEGKSDDSWMQFMTEDARFWF